MVIYDLFHFCATKVSPMRAHQVLLIRTTPNMSNQKFWAEKNICNDLTASSMIVEKEWIQSSEATFLIQRRSRLHLILYETFGLYIKVSDLHFCIHILGHCLCKLKDRRYTLAKTEIIYPKNVMAKLAMDFTKVI